MNFSSILQVIAILAFGVGILGVAFTFTLASQGRSARGGVLLAIAGFVVGIVMFVVSSGILIVEPARAAVIINVLTGELEDPARAPGTSIIIPGLQEFVIYPTDQQEYTMSGLFEEGQRQGDDAVIVILVRQIHGLAKRKLVIEYHLIDRIRRKVFSLRHRTEGDDENQQCDDRYQ